LLKLWRSRFSLFADNDISKHWIPFRIHYMHATTSCWDETRTDTEPSRGSTYHLQCITVPLRSQSTKLFTVLRVYEFVRISKFLNQCMAVI
jgi:hypothetical protein